MMASKPSVPITKGNAVKKAIADKWVAALRSGQYKQTRGQLRSAHDSFCCLGVLCNLHAKEHPKISAQEYDRQTYLGKKHYLPNEVMKWSGIAQHCGLSSDPNGEALSTLNDVKKWSFAEIATYIEANYKLL